MVDFSVDSSKSNEDQDLGQIKLERRRLNRMRSLKIEKTFNKDDVFVSSFKSRIYPNLLL